MEEWKKFVSVDFLMNVAAVIAGLFAWHKFLAKKL